MFDPLGANNVNHNLNNTSDNVINHEIVTKLQQKSEDQDMRKNKINNDSVFLKVIDFEKTKMLHKESKKNEKKLEKSEKLKSSSLTNNDDQKFEFGGFKLNDSPTRIGNKEDGDALNAITSNNVNNNTNNQDNSNSLFDDSPIAPKSITSTINNNNNNNSIKTATVTRRTSTVAYENSNDNDNVDDLKISKTLLIREDRKADADMFGTSFTANKLKGDKKKLKREETHTEETTSELDSLVGAISQLETASNKPAPKTAVTTNPSLASAVDDTPDVDIDMNKFDIDSYINSQSGGGGLFD